MFTLKNSNSNPNENQETLIFSTDFTLDVLRETIKVSCDTLWLEEHWRRRDGESIDICTSTRSFHLEIEDMMKYPVFKKKYEAVEDVLQQGKCIIELIKKSPDIAEAIVKENIQKLYGECAKIEDRGSYCRCGDRRLNGWYSLMTPIGNFFKNKGLEMDDEMFNTEEKIDALVRILG